MNKQKIVRILLCPFVFISGLFILAAGTVLAFPFGFIVMFSFVGLLIEPFIWLFKQGGSNIIGMEPMFADEVDNRALAHLLGLTIHIWGAFFVTYWYIKTGKLIVSET